MHLKHHRPLCRSTCRRCGVVPVVEFEQEMYCVFTRMVLRSAGLLFETDLSAPVAHRDTTGTGRRVKRVKDKVGVCEV